MLVGVDGEREGMLSTVVLGLHSHFRFERLFFFFFLFFGWLGSNLCQQGAAIKCP